MYSLCPGARKIGHALTGATGTLLFYSLLPDKKIQVAYVFHWLPWFSIHAKYFNLNDVIFLDNVNCKYFFFFSVLFCCQKPNLLIKCFYWIFITFLRRHCFIAHTFFTFFRRQLLCFKSQFFNPVSSTNEIFYRVAKFFIVHFLWSTINCHEVHFKCSQFPGENPAGCGGCGGSGVEDIPEDIMEAAR